jgi:hypothetical protein
MSDYLQKTQRLKNRTSATRLWPTAFFSNKRAGHAIAARRAASKRRGCGHRRTGIVANRGGSSYSEKGAEIEGVRDRCILKRTDDCVDYCRFKVRALYLQVPEIARFFPSARRSAAAHVNRVDAEKPKHSR